MPEIRYSAEFNKEYAALRSRAERHDSEANYLVELLQKATAKLSANVETGTKIPRRLWLREYVQKYGVRNLWKINLDSNWRLLYTVMGQQLNLIVIYLENMAHKEYDRKFGYKTS